jgi:putative spermidine/putrescine transport system substrate-binding protein
MTCNCNAVDTISSEKASTSDHPGLRIRRGREPMERKLSMSRHALTRGALVTCLSLSTLLGGLVCAKAQTLSDIEAAARKEGKVVSLGMPDDWANWGEIWKALNQKYGVTHTDTDMSSGEAVAKIEAEKSNPSADITEIGIEFVPIAIAKGLSMPYKTSKWDQIPEWARDKDGQWALSYTGTIAFLISKDVKNPPKTFADLVNGDYKVTIGEVGKATQSNLGVLAAAYALGGNEGNMQPAIDMFAKLAEQKRLLSINVDPAQMEKGEVQVGIVWDFNALAYRDIAGKDKWDVVIPADGSLTGGYTTTINAYALHPNIAKLVREYAFTDAGQIAFARGYARPIRIDQITLPPDAAAKMLPSSEYAKARLFDSKAWTAAAPGFIQTWQEQVASKM